MFFVGVLLSKVRMLFYEVTVVFTLLVFQFGTSNVAVDITVPVTVR